MAYTCVERVLDGIFLVSVRFRLRPHVAQIRTAIGVYAVWPPVEL